MEVINFTTLRTNLKSVLDSVIDDNENVIINRGSKNAIMISLDEYNSWQETLHLLSTKANRERLDQALERDKKKKYLKKALIKE
jgi:antitoxin YefM